MDGWLVALRMPSFHLVGRDPIRAAAWRVRVLGAEGRSPITLPNGDVSLGSTMPA
jgi:hypothetical protein